MEDVLCAGRSWLSTQSMMLCATTGAFYAHRVDTGSGNFFSLVANFMVRLRDVPHEMASFQSHDVQMC